MARIALRFGIVTIMNTNESYAMPARGGNVIITDSTGLQASVDETTWIGVNAADLKNGINGRFLRTSGTGIKVSITQF